MKPYQYLLKTTTPCNFISTSYKQLHHETLSVPPTNNYTMQPYQYLLQTTTPCNLISTSYKQLHHATLSVPPTNNYTMQPYQYVVTSSLIQENIYAIHLMHWYLATNADAWNTVHDCCQSHSWQFVNSRKLNSWN